MVERKSRGGSHYNSSKFVVVAIPQVPATSDLLKQNITSNAMPRHCLESDVGRYLPGSEEPGRNGGSILRPQCQVGIPQGRPQTPEGMGMLALYYATNPDVTGQCWNLDGGIVVEH